MNNKTNGQDKVAIINAQIVTVDTQGSVIDNGSLVVEQTVLFEKLRVER